ncbi:MAG: hypothetical protein ABI333_11750 [bacterium]
MKRLLWALPLLLTLLDSRPASAITVDEIILLCKTGVSAEIVIQNIQNAPSRPTITATDVEKMTRGNVPRRVIDFLLKGSDSGSALPNDRRATEARRAQDAAKQREEERRREAERLRLEAERLKLEARRLARDAQAAKTRSAQLEGQVKTVLGAAFENLRRGREWDAATGLHAFLHSGLVQPNSYPYLEASYGLGRAFFGVNMYQAASGYLVEVIRRGPTTPRFDSAVSLLQRIVDKLEFVHPVIALLAAFESELKGRPRAWLDEYHYFLGEFYERYDNAKKALHHFGSVSKAAKRYPAARYHLGLIYTGNKKARTAVRFFREALAAAKVAKNRSVADLASQALARLAFEIGSFRAAAHFYQRIGRRSRAFARAQYELAWTQVMSEKYRRALGTIHGLRSPFFQQEYFSDLLVLEAATYLNICRYREAKQTLKRYDKRFNTIVGQIRKYLARRPSETQLYLEVRRLATRSPQAVLPRLVLYALVADVGFYRTLKTAQQLELERTLAAKHLSGKARRAVQSDLNKRHKIYMQRVGLEIRRRLRDILVQQDTVKVKADEIGLEVELAEKSQLEAARRKLQAGRTDKTQRQLPRTLRLQLRPGQQTWPFEGEYWLDEIGRFRSRLRAACPVRRASKTNRKGAPRR